MRLVASCLVMLACSQPPAVSGVDPSEGLPGSEIKVVGERFGDEVSLSLSPVGGGACEKSSNPTRKQPPLSIRAQVWPLWK